MKFPNRKGAILRARDTRRIRANLANCNVRASVFEDNVNNKQSRSLNNNKSYAIRFVTFLSLLLGNVLQPLYSVIVLPSFNHIGPPVIIATVSDSSWTTH
jgi:hypothetical protein